MRRFIIDRFEGDYAICEEQNVRQRTCDAVCHKTETDDIKMVAIKRASLPDTAAEGDVIFFDGHRFSIDTVASQERRKIIRDKMDQLFID